MNKQFPNIILITADSLRADYCGILNNGRKRNPTPFLRKMKNKFLVFTNAYSSAPYTSFAIPSLMTGTFPLFKCSPKIGSRITIAEILRELGYITVGYLSYNPYARFFSGNGRGFFIFKEVGDTWFRWKFKGTFKEILQKTREIWKYFNKILKLKKVKTKREDVITLYEETVRNLLENLVLVAYNALPISQDLFRSYFLYAFTKILLGKLEGLTPSQQDYTITTLGINALEKIQKELHRPVFLWLHYMSTHLPYGRINDVDWQDFRSYLSRRALIDAALTGIELSKKKQEIIKRYYWEGVRAFDECMKQLFRGLEERDLLQDTVIIITADHGEELFDHGGYGHQPNLYNENLHIPLLIFKEESSDKINIPASLMDIVPTILGIVSDKNKRGKRIKSYLEKILDGRDLLNLVQGEKDGHFHRIILSEACKGKGLEDQLFKIMMGNLKELFLKDLQLLVRASSDRGFCILISSRGNVLNQYLAGCSEHCKVALRRIQEIMLNKKDKAKEEKFKLFRALYLKERAQASDFHQTNKVK